MTQHVTYGSSLTALVRAVKRWDVARTTRLLVRAPQLATVCSPTGHTALHAACGARAGRLGLSETAGLETVMLLLTSGADPNACAHARRTGPRGATPLHCAVSGGAPPSLVRLLLEHGANPTDALWPAIRRDEGETIRLLASFKPNLHECVADEYPLFFAVRRSRTESVRALLEAGVDPLVTDRWGRNVVDIARGYSVRGQIYELVEKAARDANRVAHGDERSAPSVALVVQAAVIPEPELSFAG